MVRNEICYDKGLFPKGLHDEIKTHALKGATLWQCLKEVHSSRSSQMKSMESILISLLAVSSFLLSSLVTTDLGHIIAASE